jgi:RNA polymerase sigma factor (sigma-70 family)
MSNDEIVHLIKYSLGRNNFKGLDSDVLHDVIVEVLSKQHKFDPERSKMSTYIVNSSRWSALSCFHKKTKTKQFVNLDDVSKEEKSMIYQFTPELDQKDSFDYLHKKIQGLDALEQVVIVLKFFENVSMKDISALLNIKKQRIDDALKSAITKLRNTVRSEDVI